MRVLLTGIDGFVGSHAADLLVAAGVEVHGTVLHFDALRNIAHLRQSLTLHQADISDAGKISALVRSLRPDRILHIAGQAFVPRSLQSPLETFHTNLLGGLNILEASRQLLSESGKSPAVLIVSSGEVYGRVEPRRLPMTEEFPLMPKTPYAASKAGLDMIAQQYAECFGVHVLIVRPFNHAGPRQSPSFVVSDFAKQFAEIASGKREPVLHVGDIAAKRDFTDVRDVVRAYWALFEKRTDDFIFNVCSGRSMEIREILLGLEEISGLRVEITQDPERLRSYDVTVVAASNERLRKATGWLPQIPLHQTLRDVYTYWQEFLRSTSAVQPSSS